MKTIKELRTENETLILLNEKLKGKVANLRNDIANLESKNAELDSAKSMYMVFLEQSKKELAQSNKKLETITSVIQFINYK